MVETLMLLEVNVVQVLVNPRRVRPEKVPLILALGLDPVHVFEYIEDSIVERASKTYCSICYARRSSRGALAKAIRWSHAPDLSFAGEKVRLGDEMNS